MSETEAAAIGMEDASPAVEDTSQANESADKLSGAEQSRTDQSAGGQSGANPQEAEQLVAALGDDDGERVLLNMGPSHPSTHGVLRLMLELSGETVLRSKPVIGYLHTGMEKTGEKLTYMQGGTNVTRMDYASPLFTELAYSMAVERLLGIEVPDRAVWIRMLMCELNG